MLELDQLLAKAASLAQSPMGAALVQRLRPCPDIKTVRRRQRRLAQIRELLNENGHPSLSGLEPELGSLFSRLEVEGAFLMPEELDMVALFLGAVSRSAAFLAPAEGQMDEARRLHNQITPLNREAKRIRAVVGPGGTVKSSASPELARVRRDLAKSRDRLRSQLTTLISSREYTGLLSDQIVTQRADRFVVPVKTDAKGRVGGIIHDTSGSGATCFVEPLEAVEGNNQLALLRRREKEEVEKVLMELSAQLAVQRQALGENLAALAKLDCLLAQAAFCARLDCLEPELNQAGELDLIGVRHPLLVWRALAGRGRAAPINLRLGPQAPVLVISGANAGGKTAALKTAGLTVLMAMCGLAVPAGPGSRAPVMRWVGAELGDEQDLDRELSTFTAHAGSLSRMIKRAGPKALFLIDELGGGTDPEEGAALGIAVLELLAKKGARVMCTTHFHRLKAYAASAEGVENASVAFDQSSGEPTYQLSYGRPGFSDALAVSRGLGFPPEVIDRAEQEVDQAEQRTVALLRQAEEERQQAMALRREAMDLQKMAAEERRSARAMLREAKQKRAEALAEGKRRVRDVARRMEERLEGIIEGFGEAEQGQKPRPGGMRQQIYQARRQALEQVSRAVGDAPRAPRQSPASLYHLKAGDPVRLLNLGQSGVLLEEPRPSMDTVAVSVGAAGVRVMARLNEMEPLPKAASPAPAPANISVRADAGDGLDLKLIGLRVEDALPAVDKALDQAILAGRKSMRIVHGVGTGALRKAVRDYLSRHPQVVSAKAPEGRSSAGVTVAELRS